MDQPYFVVADVLIKFHTATPPIQALWLVVVPLTVLGMAYCVSKDARDIALALLDRRGVAQGRPVYAIDETSDGRWMLYAGGKVSEVSGADISEDLVTLPAPVLH